MLFPRRVLRLALIVPSFTILAQATTADTCRYFNNFDLTAALNQALHITIPDIFGNINQCICDSGVPSFINTNIVTELAVSLAGVSAVQSALINLIHTGSQTCTYPTNAIPQCSSSQTCGYVCASGFSLCPNGDCDLSCPSSGPQRRSVQQQLLRKTQCPVGWEICGGFTNTFAYECIDTRTTLDSCGGCLYPYASKKATGRDCSAIDGAENVSCRRGRCVVESCMNGMSVSADGQDCIF